MDSSESHHSSPGSVVSPCSSSSSGGSIDNNRLPPRKRYKSFTPDIDDGIMCHSMPPCKRHHHSKENLDNTASKTISSWRKIHEIDLLKSILDYYDKNGAYPFDDSSHMQNFYKAWIERRGVYVDEDVFTSKLVELPERFFTNHESITSKKFRGKAQDWMDPSDIEIYRLSYTIWGNKDDD